MKDFKLKTLAAVCLFTASVYGMENSPESSERTSDPYLYCVHDEDIDKEQDEQRRYFLIQGVNEIIDSMYETIDSRYDVYDKFKSCELMELLDFLSSAIMQKIIGIKHDEEGESREELSVMFKDALERAHARAFSETEFLLEKKKS